MYCQPKFHTAIFCTAGQNSDFIYPPQVHHVRVLHVTMEEVVQTLVIHMNVDVLLDFWEIDAKFKVIGNISLYNMIYINECN